jgi:hypothetical protein
LSFDIAFPLKFANFGKTTNKEEEKERRKEKERRRKREKKMEQSVFTEDEIARLYGYNEKNKKEVFVHIDPSVGGYTKTHVVAMIVDNGQYIVVKEGCNPPFGKFLSELREMFPVANILIDVESLTTAIGRGVVHAIVTLELEGVEFVIRNENKVRIPSNVKEAMVTCLKFTLKDGKLKFHKCLGEEYPGIILGQLLFYKKRISTDDRVTYSGKKGNMGDDELMALMACLYQFERHTDGINDLSE